MTNYNLPDGYVENLEPRFHDEAMSCNDHFSHQPDVYRLADYLLRATGRNTVLDIGCGNGGKLATLINCETKVGIDFRQNIAAAARAYPGAATWIDADLTEQCNIPQTVDARNCIAVCADVIEHMQDPTHVLQLWRSLVESGAILITSTPDRQRVRGRDHNGPPPNPAHVREWSMHEYVSFLQCSDLPPSFSGYTINNSVEKQPWTILTIHDKKLLDAMKDPVLAQRPLAILSCFNDSDVIAEVVGDWISHDCDVYAVDNWSSDSTFDILQALVAQHPGRITVERFPEQAPRYYEWRAILRRKEEIASAMPHRWVIHTDSDELRRPPWPNMTLAQGLAVVEAYGSNRVDFTLMNFRPTATSSFEKSLDEMRFFEYGSRPGHFIQKKAWRQSLERVQLASSGGHEATFDGAADFPYKFLLRHYPIRSHEHGQKKIFQDRVGRWHPEERAVGWHTHYDDISTQTVLTWNESTLIGYDVDTLLNELPMLVSDLSNSIR